MRLNVGGGVAGGGNLNRPLESTVVGPNTNGLPSSMAGNAGDNGLVIGVEGMDPGGGAGKLNRCGRDSGD